MSSKKSFRWSPISKRVLPIDEWHEENQTQSENKAPAGHNYKGGFNAGLGIYTGSKSDERDQINRIKDKTGSNVVEIGTERMNLKPQMGKVDMQAASEYAQHLNNGH